MEVYFIEYPSVSAGFKRTYCKKLEVFCGEAKPFPYNGKDYYAVPHVPYVYRYHAKKGIWEKKPNSKSTSIGRMLHLSSQAETTKRCLYLTLEAACAAKILLIQRMAETYKAELKQLQELFERNVPDVQQPLSQLLEEHPDLFI